MTERRNITNVIMQGTVWAGLQCTSERDTLGKASYENPYMYTGQVKIPMLGMVDDVLTVTTCSNQSIVTNATVNTFMETSKLELAPTKCSQIHIGKKCETCPKLFVHKEPMKKSSKEKYLGDYISENGKIQDTINDRISRAWAYLSEIKAILSEMPLGKRKIETGLILREAMFVNGVCFNSEAWHGVKATQIAQLEVVDHQLLRVILGAHAKTAVEFLYLETGAIPLRFIISSRRLNYHKHIIDRNETELIKRVYREQLKNTTKGDWIELLKDDFKTINKEMNEAEIKNKTKTEYKMYIKKEIKEATFKYLRKLQEGHTKVKEIKYTNMKVQEYLKSHMKNDHKELLMAVRSKMVRTIQNNFKNHNQEARMCPLCKESPDSQEHCMACPIIINGLSDKMDHISYEHAFAELPEQLNFIDYFSRLLGIREQLLEEASLPGQCTGP
jgi:hypothetical protein